MNTIQLGSNISKATTYRTKHGNKKEASWIVGHEEGRILV